MSNAAWLEVDGERTWAPAGLTLDASGITMTKSGRRVHAPWSDVLGVTRVGTTIYVLVPRRPPHPPWIAIDEAPDGRDVEELAAEIRERSERAGYREASSERTLLAPEDLLARVLARDDVPGTVEVPARFARPRPPYQAVLALGGAGIGFVAGAGVGAYIGSRELAAYTGYPLGLVGMIAGARLARALDRGTAPRPRLMVLAPDGIVSALDGVVRATRWDRIERLDVALEADAAGDVAERLRLRTKKGKTHRVELRWIDAPAELVVAVAEAYRVRWSAACARARDRARDVAS